MFFKTFAYHDVFSMFGCRHRGCEAFWNQQDDLFREPGAFVAGPKKILKHTSQVLKKIQDLGNLWHVFFPVL